MSEIARTTTTANEPLIQETEDWFDERLDIGALYRKYGRKVFPVHSTFFFGEMALFAFVILVVTGGYPLLAIARSARCGRTPRHSP